MNEKKIFSHCSETKLKYQYIISGRVDILPEKSSKTLKQKPKLKVQFSQNQIKFKIMTNLFDVTPNLDTTKHETQTHEFRPRANKAADKVYKATVRFLPYWQNPSNSLQSKYTVWLENKMTHEKRELDDPSTVGEQSVFTQVFFELRNSTNPVLKENSKMFSRRLRYAALVQVLSCPSEPSVEGKILVWRFGTKVANLIEQQIQPVAEQIQPVSPFSLLSGRALALRVTITNGGNGQGGYDNFDGSMFFDSTDDTTKVKCPVTDAQGKVTWVPINAETIKNENFRNTVNEWLKSGPDLEQYAYHPITDDDKKFVMDVVNIARNPQASIAAAQASFGGFNAAAPAAAAPHMDNVGIPSSFSPQTPVAPAAQPIPQVQAPTMDVAAPSAPQAGFSQSTGIPGNLDEILGAAPTAPAQPATPATPAAPAGGISLNDVLGDIL